jgi:hypothetical protein
MKWFKNLFKKKTKEPYVSIIGENIDPENGIEIALDWNAEFIKYLKQHGYTGTSDELIVQKWLQSLYNDMSTKLGENNKFGEFE